MGGAICSKPSCREGRSRQDDNISNPRLKRFACPAAGRRRRRGELAENTRKLRVVLQTDRHVYFPAEDATLKVAVENPTPQILEVFEPFHVQNGTIVLHRRYPDRYKSYQVEWWPVSPDAMRYSYSGPTTWIPAGQRTEKEFVFSDPATHSPRDAHGNATAALCLNCQIPEQVGEYRFVYMVGAYAEFRVVEPKLELWQIVPFEKPYEYRNTDIRSRGYGKVSLMKRAALVMVLSYEGESFIAVTRYAGWGAGPNAEIPANVRLAGSSPRNFTPYVRVASSTRLIKSLQAVADPAENIAITSTDQDGRTLRIKPKHPDQRGGKCGNGHRHVPRLRRNG